MTELLIVSKPRGRIFKWIGGGIYKEYLNPIIGSDDLRTSHYDLERSPELVRNIWLSNSMSSRLIVSRSN